MIPRHLIYCCLMLPPLFMACGSPDPEPPVGHAPPPLSRDQSRYDQPSGETRLSEKRRIVFRQALASIGVPYQWGGASLKSGFDCSGLVVHCHQKAGISVPRTAREQWAAGNQVSGRPFMPGDLVFFRIPKLGKDGLHVGIYAGNGLFVHAPGEGRTVMRSRLDNPYFKKNIVGAVTYLD